MEHSFTQTYSIFTEPLTESNYREAEIIVEDYSTTSSISNSQLKSALTMESGIVVRDENGEVVAVYFGYGLQADGFQTCFLATNELMYYIDRSQVIESLEKEFEGIKQNIVDALFAIYNPTENNQ